MSPLFFEPAAEIAAQFAVGFKPLTILETAAGTGIVSRALHEALPAASIVGTDINEAMLAVASQRLRTEHVRFVPKSIYPPGLQVGGSVRFHPTK